MFSRCWPFLLLCIAQLLPPALSWERGSYNSKALSPWHCTGRFGRTQPMVDYSSLVQRSPQECLGSVLKVNLFGCFRRDLIFLGWPLKPYRVILKGPNTMIRATMLLSTLYLKPPILSRPPICCTLPLPHLQCLKETHESRPFIFTICSIQCIWTSPWGKCGWTSWNHSPSYLGPFSLTQCLPPVNYLLVVPQSLMQIPMVLPNLSSKVMELFWLSHWDDTSIFWEGSKCRSQLQLGTSDCASMGSCFNFQCLSGLQSGPIVLTMKSGKLGARSKGSSLLLLVAILSSMPRSLLPTGNTFPSSTILDRILPLSSPSSSSIKILLFLDQNPF